MTLHAKLEVETYLYLSCIGFTEADCSTLYQKAIWDNPTITLHISKAMTVGPPQVGKTTLRRRLLGIPQPEISISTDVLEKADTVMCLSDGAIPSDDIGLGPSSGSVQSDEHSSDSEGEASSSESDDDLGQIVAKRCKYECDTYIADGDEWVLVNNTSGLRKRRGVLHPPRLEVELKHPSSYPVMMKHLFSHQVVILSLLGINPAQLQT